MDVDGRDKLSQKWSSETEPPNGPLDRHTTQNVLVPNSEENGMMVFFSETDGRPKT